MSVELLTNYIFGYEVNSRIQISIPNCLLNLSNFFLLFIAHLLSVQNFRLMLDAKFPMSFVL
jgi:hypothetical protein